MNKTDLRNIIAKLHEIEHGPKEPVNEAIPNPFGFLRGLGKGAKNAPKIEPVGSGAAHGAEELISAAAQDANKRLSLLRRITPAEAAAAKAEGITIDEMLMRKFPDTFAKLEKNPELLTKVNQEFTKAADEILVAAERGEDPRALWPKEEKFFSKDGQKSFALSALLHALIVLGLLIADKHSSSSSGPRFGQSSSSGADLNDIPADEIPWSTYLGMDPRQGDSLKRGLHQGIAPWKIISPAGVAIAKINGPVIVDKIEKLAAMTPEQRKKLAQAEPKTSNFEVDLYRPDTQQPTVKELPKAADKGSPATVPENDPEIVIAKKKKKKEEEEAQRKKKEAEAAKKAEEDKKRKILPTLTF